jgi:hypothetical protein
MYSFDDVCAFLVKRLRVDPSVVTPLTSLRHDLGVEGDDFFELEEAFADEFRVDMSEYRWYFHHGEEGTCLNVGRLLFPAPYDRVTEIPVTPQLLLDSANAGKWVVRYPEHKLPSRRYDVLVNQLVYLPLIGFLLVPVLLKVRPEVFRLTFEASLGAVAAVTWRRYVLKQSGRSLVIGLISAATGVMCYLLSTSIWAYDAAARRSAFGTNASDSVWILLHEWHTSMAAVLGVTIATGGAILRRRSRSAD